MAASRSGSPEFSVMLGFPLRPFPQRPDAALSADSTLPRVEGLS